MTERHILLANVFFAPFSYGGATIVAEQVAQSLLRRGGYRITATSLCCRHDIAPYAVIKSEQQGITNYIINVPPGREYDLLYENPGVTRELTNLIEALKPDLVHAHCIQDMGTGILEAAAEAGVPSILSTHDFWWICDRQFMIRVDNTFCGQNPIRLETCRSCVEDFEKAKTRFDHLQSRGPLAEIITYPSEYARDLSASSGFAPDKGVVWENGVRQPAPDFFARQAARRAADPRLTFGFVGGPSHMKGWPLIRRAFAGLNRDDFKVQVVEGSLDGAWWAGHRFDDLPGEWGSIHGSLRNRWTTTMRRSTSFCSCRNGKKPLAWLCERPWLEGLR
ncbi:glycosyltransferase [Sulfitobacter aestuariivivens]|uniref:glycosyltransferase n=1 Tax=Sulfitobacter aestuariivivens TaxID=2766981 RepID=UPI00360ED8EC